VTMVVDDHVDVAGLLVAVDQSDVQAQRFVGARGEALTNC
jgi:hypothetical protein